jgi:AcrR family transcriptional regulator
MERSAGKVVMQERILKTADSLFYGEGIRAVGVDTIASEVGISKRTLYNYFPSKDDLIVAYLARRLRPTAVSELPPAEQILGNFDQLERSLADDGFRGCPFVNAVAELKEPGHAANKIALTFKDQSRTWFRELLSRLEIANPESLAMQLMLLVDGAIAAAVVRRDPKMARTAREAARVLLVAAGVDSPAVSAKREQPLKRRPHRGSSRRSAV